MARASSGHRSATPEQQCLSALSLGVASFQIPISDPPAKAPEIRVIGAVFRLTPLDIKVCVSPVCEQREQFPFLTRYRDSSAERDWKSLNDKLSLGAGLITDTALLALLNCPSEGGMPQRWQCTSCAHLQCTCSTFFTFWIMPVKKQWK